MKKILAVSMVVAIAGAASANLLTNGDFETPFTDGYGQAYSPAVDGSFAYIAQTAFALPGWSGASNWGYVWNPTGSGGVNHWGTTVGLTTVAEGGGAMGNWGAAGHLLDAWQNTGGQGAEGDTVSLTFSVNSLSADYGANAWMNVNLQFLGDNQVSWNYNATTSPQGLAQDTWTQFTLEVPALTAGQAGKDIQVHVQGAGVWIDAMDLTVIPEPATLGLVAMFGGGIFAVRRKFMI